MANEIENESSAFTRTIRSGNISAGKKAVKDLYTSYVKTKYPLQKNFKLTYGRDPSEEEISKIKTKPLSQQYANKFYTQVSTRYLQ